MTNLNSHIQVPADSSGKKIETKRILTGDANATEYQRQSMDIPDLGLEVGDYLRLILTELRVITVVLTEGFEAPFDVRQLRSDIETGDYL